jgi:hypothetical protein
MGDEAVPLTLVLCDLGTTWSHLRFGTAPLDSAPRGQRHIRLVSLPVNPTT